MSDLVVLTGGSGYIARHILLQLLDGGWSVRATVRSESKAAQTRAAVAAARPALDLEARLSFVSLDLTRDEGWAAAMDGVSVVIHTASPFPLDAPKDPQTVIAPAVEGTRRVLGAAAEAGVGRVVLTSSVAAVEMCALPDGQNAYTEAEWTDLSAPGLSAYYRSKTEAERAAWALAEANPALALTVINPGFVLGAPVGDSMGTSLEVVARILEAKDPALPDIAFGCVDVRDIAAMHVAALTRPHTAGRRYIGVDRTLSFREIAEEVKLAAPGRKIVTRVAPHVMIRLLALFDAGIRTIVPVLGKRALFDASRAKDDLGVAFRDARLAVGESAEYLVGAGGAT